jgi:hypothetical protein
MPRLFIVATILRPTRPLLPTPHIISLPPASFDVFMTSTACSRPSRAIWSDSYKMVTCESAVAAVERTLTARDSNRVPSGSVAVNGGVSGCVSEPARFRLRDEGDVDMRGGVVFSSVAAIVDDICK